jgi:hypothetical protein
VPGYACLCAWATHQHCQMVTLSTLPTPHSTEAAQASHIMVVASRNSSSAWASPTPQLLPSCLSHVGREGVRRQRRQPALARPAPVGHPPGFGRATVFQAAGARPSCYGSGFGHNRVCSSPGLAGIMRNWGNSPGHLADLKRMLQRTVDGQRMRPDGAATGWIQWVLYRSWQFAIRRGLWALGATGASGG